MSKEIESIWLYKITCRFLKELYNISPLSEKDLFIMLPGLVQDKVFQ